MTAIPKPKRIIDRQYREWVKTKPCLLMNVYKIGDRLVRTLPGYYCAGEMDPHHVIPEGGGKTGSKVSDYRCVPLCREHHGLAGAHPRSFDDEFEAEILRLNADYQRALKPKKRPVQRMKVTLSIQRCLECGHPHEIPLQKVQKGRTWKFRCIRTNHFIEVA